MSRKNDLPKVKPILCLDFDGVIHSYKSGWHGPRCIPDDPVPGAFEFICEAMKDFTVAIYSSRSRYLFGRWAMKQWFKRNLTNHILTERPEFNDPDPMNEDRSMADSIAQSTCWSIKWPSKKPPAFLQIDDRAITFRGTWPSIAGLKQFKPWNK